MYNYVSNNFWFTFLASVQDYDINNPSNREKSFLLLCHGTKISRSQQTKIYLYIIIIDLYDFCVHDCTQEQNGAQLFLYRLTLQMTVSVKNDQADLAIERERQLTTGTPTERTERDFRCPILFAALPLVKPVVWFAHALVN